MATYDTTQSARRTRKEAVSPDTRPFEAYDEKVAAADLSKYRKNGPRPWPER